MSKTMTIGDILDTDAKIERAKTLFRELHGTGRFAAKVREELIEPYMTEINARLGQANDASYLAYAVEYIFLKASSNDSVAKTDHRDPSRN